MECGIDLVGTTLSGYTNESAPTLSGPDLDLLRSLVNELRVPIIAEGRYAMPSEAQAALAIGAMAVASFLWAGSDTRAPVRAAPVVTGSLTGVAMFGTW